MESGNMSNNISGIFFRMGRENICFENLPTEEQDKIIDSYTVEQQARLCKILSQHVGAHFYLNNVIKSSYKSEIKKLAEVLKSIDENLSEDSQRKEE